MALRTKENYIKPSRATTGVYGIFTVLVTIDVLLSIFSPYHLNAYGEVKDISDIIIRFLPDICLLIFFSKFFYHLISYGKVNNHSIFRFSILEILLGLSFIIPFFIVLTVQLTPMSLVLRFLVLNFAKSSAYNDGYLSMIVLGVAFASLNFFVMFDTISNSIEKANLLVGLSYISFVLAGALLITDLFSLAGTQVFHPMRFVVVASFLGLGMLARYLARRYSKG